jgi:hypothetical protein
MKNKYSTWGKLVCSLISVNKWGISKSLDIYDKLEKQGLFDLEGIQKIDDIPEIGNRLKAAGYDRGALTYMISERLIHCADKVCANGLDKSESLLSKRDGDSQAFLLSLKGLGPKSVEVFYSID